MKVLVTGASGYLGEHIVSALLRESHDVRALVRRTSCIEDLASDVELVHGDLRDLESLLAAFQGCHAVIHAGAMVSPWSPTPALYCQVNVEGLKNVIEALKRTPSVKKLIYVSSYFAIGPTGDSPANESQLHPGSDFTSEYERSKYLADTVARDAVNEGVPLIITYPGVLYGPGKQTGGNLLAATLVERFSGRLPGYLGPGNDRNPFCHIEDVANAHVAMLEKGRVGERYILCGPSISMNDVLDSAANCTKTSRPHFTVPLWAMEVLGRISVIFARIFKFTPSVSPEVVAVMKKKWNYTSDKAREELGYETRPFQTGLAEVLLAMKEKSVIRF